MPYCTTLSETVDVGSISDTVARTVRPGRTSKVSVAARPRRTSTMSASEK